MIEYTWMNSISSGVIGLRLYLLFIKFSSTPDPLGVDPMDGDEVVDVCPVGVPPVVTKGAEDNASIRFMVYNQIKMKYD